MAKNDQPAGEAENAAPKEEGSGDTAGPGAGSVGQDTGQPPIIINAQYVKDLSFENPSAPGIFSHLQNSQPDVRINVNVNAVPVEEATYEVQLDLKAECRTADMTGFIMELVYAGIFTLNVPQDAVQAVLLIECPRLLFPFARNILADVTRDGGFPPVMLGPVDFAAMYQARLAELQDQGSGTA